MAFEVRFLCINSNLPIILPNIFDRFFLYNLLCNCRQKDNYKIYHFFFGNSQKRLKSVYSRFPFLWFFLHEVKCAEYNETSWTPKRSDIQTFDKYVDFLTKISIFFLTKISICWRKNRFFLTKISIFWRKFRFFLTKISTFWRKFLFLFDDYFYFFLTKFLFFSNISIFEKNFDFWRKFRFLTKISIFWQKYQFCLR